MTTFTGRSDGTDLSGPFQNWVSNLCRRREYGIVTGPVYVGTPIRFTGTDWKIEFRHGTGAMGQGHYKQGIVYKLDAPPRNTIVAFRDCNRFEIEGTFPVYAEVDGPPTETCREMTGITFEASSGQYGYARIDRLAAFNCRMGIHVDGDCLEQTRIEQILTKNCPQGAYFDCHAMDDLVIGHLNCAQWRGRPTTAPVVYIYRTGKLIIQSGSIAQIDTNGDSAAIRLHGGLHVLRDIHIEMPGTRAIDLTHNGIHRNDTILDGIVASDYTLDHQGLSGVCNRNGTRFVNCAFPGDIYIGNRTVVNSHTRFPEGKGFVTSQVGVV